jgi:hypothetical protein
MSFEHFATLKIWPHAGVAGHSGLLLHDYSYITWLHDDDQELVLGGRYSYGRDWQKHQAYPLVQVKVPVRFGDIHCGLDAAAIHAWWDRHRSAHHAYIAISKTRSSHGVVAQALCAGRAELYAKAPTNFVYQGSVTLQRWGTDLRSRIMALQALFAQAMGELLNGLPYWMPNVAGAAKPEIMSLEEWRRCSAAGALAARREQVASIDGLLPEYHAIHQGPAPPRLSLLYDILLMTVEHLRTKPYSPRRAGVMTLGRQVFDKVQELEQAQLGIAGMVAAAH